MSHTLRCTSPPPPSTNWLNNIYHQNLENTQPSNMNIRAFFLGELHIELIQFRGKKQRTRKNAPLQQDDQELRLRHPAVSSSQKKRSMNAAPGLLLKPPKKIGAWKMMFLFNRGDFLVVMFRGVNQVMHGESFRIIMENASSNVLNVGSLGLGFLDLKSSTGEENPITSDDADLTCEAVGIDKTPRCVW